MGQGVLRGNRVSADPDMSLVNEKVVGTAT
jgi:hypothetical protein